MMIFKDTLQAYEYLISGKVDYREKALLEVVKNPVYSYLFLLNCTYNYTERKLALEGIIKNQECIYNFLSMCRYTVQEFKDMLDLLANNEFFFEAFVTNHKFDEEEKTLLIETLGKHCTLSNVSVVLNKLSFNNEQKELMDSLLLMINL